MLRRRIDGNRSAVSRCILDTSLRLCYIRFNMSSERLTNGFHFEEFTGVPRTTKGQLCVSIYSTGRMFLNAKTVSALGHPEKVILFFDQHKLVIGVKPTYNPVPHAIRVRRSSVGHQITVSEFLEKNNVDLGYSIRFLDPYVEEDGTLILDLNRTTRVVGSRTIARHRSESEAKPRQTRRAY